MKQYNELVERILAKADRLRPDRTNTGTIGVFGHQMRFDLQDGFPLLTTKKVFTKGIIAELLWFLEGSTDNKRLNELGAKIWDSWAVKEDVVLDAQLPPYVLVERLASKLKVSNEAAMTLLESADATAAQDNPAATPMLGGRQLLATVGVEMTEKVTVVKAGALGPIYGAQWRNFGGVDQIAQLIENLRTKPFSRRHVISAWNPAALPDESISPQENVINGKMALSPCHCLFQFYVEELSLEERLALDSTVPKDMDSIEKHSWMDEARIPKYKLSCQLYQRSVDTSIGLPFNIASYALLTMMIAQCVNMVPGEFVHTSGDAHIYIPHIDKIREQITRPMFPLPTMKINPDVKDIFSFTMDDFTLVDYQCGDPINYEIAV